jgi:preprotein translocase SecE subunit
MAVAVKNTTETARRPLLDRLAVSSLVGAVYVLGSLGIVFYALPRLWAAGVSPWLTNAFLNVTLLIGVMIAAGAGLVFLGQRLVGAKARPGLRAGVFFGVLGLLAVGLATAGLGILIENLVGPANPALGVPLIGLVGLALLFLAGSVFLRAGTERWLVRVEEQGWFHAVPYKRSQGQRVRRATILGILILVGCGIYTLLSNRVLETGVRHWGPRLPYVYMVQLDTVAAANRGAVAEAVRDVGGLSLEAANDVVAHLPQTVQEYVSHPQALAIQEQLRSAGAAQVSHNRQLFPLLPNVSYTVPLLLTLATLWGAYRVVNFPPFADFLIATEAELNKVSWATRKRLVQDTIVVLTTVILLTVFLFVVDLFWFKALTWVNVLQTGPANQEKQAGPQDW